MNKSRHQRSEKSVAFSRNGRGFSFGQVIDKLHNINALNAVWDIEVYPPRLKPLYKLRKVSEICLNGLYGVVIPFQALPIQLNALSGGFLLRWSHAITLLSSFSFANPSPLYQIYFR